MEQPSPTPEPQKQAPWRPIALAAAAVGLGGALLAFGSQSDRQTPQPRPQQAPAGQMIPMMQGSLNLSMLPPDEAARAIARSDFPEQQKPALLAALKENRIRLAAMPLADATGHAGQSLTVSGAGFSQQVVLGPHPRAVLLPIAQEGIITLTRTSPARMGPLSVATLNMFRSVVVLPPLSQNSPSLSVPVIVQ